MNASFSIDSILKSTVSRLMTFGALALLIMFCTQYYVLSYQSHRAACEIVAGRLNQYLGPLSRELALGETKIAESIFHEFTEGLSRSGAGTDLKLDMASTATFLEGNSCRPTIFGAQVYQPISFAGNTLGAISGRVTYFPTIPMLLFVAFVVGGLVFTVRVWALGLIGKVRKFLIVPIKDLSKGAAIEMAETLPIEVQEVSRNINALKSRLVEEQQRSAHLDQEKKMSDLAVQVAHDIRSPLSILAMMDMVNFKFTHENQALMAAAARRIQDIAQSLTQKYYVKTDDIEASDTTLVSAVLENIVAEKRAIMEPKGILATVTVAPAARAAFAGVSGTELGRAFSNLLDNAIEALEDKPPGEKSILMDLNIASGNIEVTFNDNGRGISSDILPQLALRGTTTKPKGLGLGLFHAKTLAEKVGGTLTVESAVRVGTTVSISVPPVQSPKWFSGSFSIGISTRIVLIDDDEAMHRFWRMKLGEKFAYSAYSGNDPKLTDLAGDTENFFIVDFQMGDGPNGVEVIRSLGIAGRSLLVTSRFDDSRIQKAAEALEIKILPKPLLPSLDIKTEIPNELDDSPVHIVLIDDDPLIRQMWVECASGRNADISVFKSVEEFLTANVDHSASIFLDQHLGRGVKGTDHAWRLRDLGYSKIYLTTADQTIQAVPDFICDIRNKVFPHDLALAQ